MPPSEEQMQSHLVKFDQLNTIESDLWLNIFDSWMKFRCPASTASPSSDIGRVGAGLSDLISACQL